MGDGDFLTLTFVVRRPVEYGTVAGGLVRFVDFEDAQQLVTKDETMFFSVEDGVTDAAKRQGAEPAMWGDDGPSLADDRSVADDDLPPFNG